MKILTNFIFPSLSRSYLMVLFEWKLALILSFYLYLDIILLSFEWKLLLILSSRNICVNAERNNNNDYNMIMLLIIRFMRNISLIFQLVSAGEEVLLFYNDRASFETLVELMRSERHRTDDRSPLQHHINLVQLLALCTEGKNVYTEIKCHSLLPLDEIVRVVTHQDCIPEVCARSL